MNEQPTFGVADVWPARDLPPTPRFQQHRRITAALRTLVDQLIRVDADESVLSAYADQLETLAAAVSARPHLDHMALFDRLRRGVATREDCENIFDFEVMTGHAAVFAPPMTLWVEGETVQARATLNHVFQGPPGRVHGGVVALMMDILMARTQEVTKVLGFTGTLNLCYHAATPLDTPLEMDARVLRQDGRKQFIEGRIFANGVHTVTGEGIWIAARDENF